MVIAPLHSSVHNCKLLLYNSLDEFSLLGQISASFAAMHRTIDDYDSMAKREIIKAKQEKAQMSAMCVLLSTACSNLSFTGEFRDSELTILNYEINLKH
jgi:hypothetical protein